jgi:CYTH domain-containing protein
MLELEKTYLAKYLPEDIAKCEATEINDTYIGYIQNKNTHPKMRIRKKGDRYEITKKTQIDASDASAQEEQTMTLNAEEYAALAPVEGKKIHKIRYEYPCGDLVAEIDIFQDNLRGLVVVDVEFDTLEEKDSFPMPEFCLAEVTQEEFMAGGMLCGKRYEDIESELGRFGYEKLFLKA